MHRRYLTYSLRTLFVFTTALAVWLSVVVNRAREQREAVKAIEALGGSVFYDWQFNGLPIPTVRENSNGPAWLRRLIGEDYFQKVHAVDFSEPEGWTGPPPNAKPTESDIQIAIPHLLRLRGLKDVVISKYRHKKAETQLKTALPDCEIILFAIDR